MWPIWCSQIKHSQLKKIARRPRRKWMNISKQWTKIPIDVYGNFIDVTQGCTTFFFLFYLIINNPVSITQSERYKIVHKCVHYLSMYVVSLIIYFGDMFCGSTYCLSIDFTLYTIVLQIFCRYDYEIICRW